ncbi:propanediol utilization protein [Rhodococcus sp. SC4]|nr:propanediol utilization protein [Rhodococcus sp. SC4]
MSTIYEKSDEGTHFPASDAPDWQESVFLHWYDRASGLGGVHRIGHEPNRAGGRSALHCSILGIDGYRFRRNDFELPLEEPTTNRGFRAGGSYWHIDRRNPRLEVHEPGVDLELELFDFYPLTDFFPSGGSLVDDFAKNHYETSVRVVGKANVNGRTFEIDGLGHRDHSWGIRKIQTLLSHRWISGTFGPHLSFGSTLWHSADDEFVKVGYVVRDGEVTYAEDVDVVTWQEADGFSHRGGEVTWYLPGGEEFSLQCRQVDGTLAQLHSAYYIDSICSVQHDGNIGMCDFETSNNIRAGGRPIGLLLNAATAVGLS